MSAPAKQLHVCIPEYVLGYAYCEDMAQLSNSNSRQKVRAGSNCMCAYRIMSWGTHTARTWRNFQIQTQRKKFARVRKTRREPNLTGSDGNLRNATLEQISNDMGRCTHETHLLCGRESNAPRRSFGGWRGCLCCLCWGCCCCGDGTTNGARSRRFFHLRLHDLDMEGSVMCRLRAAVCGGVGVPTGREIQPSLRPQREVHAVSDKHKSEGGNPGMELCCPRCVKKMTPTCVSLSLPAL